MMADCAKDLGYKDSSSLVYFFKKGKGKKYIWSHKELDISSSFFNVKENI